MAIKLQKEEFDTHFTKNRTQRQTAQIDCKVSKEQQAVEDESASMQLEKSKQKMYRAYLFVLNLYLIINK